MGFPSWLRKEINRNIESLINYPDPEQIEIRKAASKHFAIGPENIIFGNGASEFISIIPDSLKIDHIIIPVPSYSEYEKQSKKIKISYFELKKEANFKLDTNELSKLITSETGRKLVFIGQPNNPTGKSIPVANIEKLAKKHIDTYFCIDESFADFIPEYRSLAEGITRSKLQNIIVIRSLTKFYGLPGLRLGLCIGSPKIIQKIKEFQIPWSVNTLALKVGEKLFDDYQFFDNSVKTVIILKEELTKKLETFSWLKLFHGEANFILIKISDKKITGNKLYSYLAHLGIIIRLCDSFDGLDNSYFRIAIRTSYENIQLITALEAFSLEIINKKISNKGTKKSIKRGLKALPLMIQGTASNAGKSILTAGLCRVLYQAGYAVAPFKAQNMSNNSAVTLDGKEMGRAQALQARACNINPDVRMNPVLLKPSSEKGSQVILNGLPSGNMTVKNWKEFKQTARVVVEKNYDDLASEYDVIIIEGAGSPGEVNLKQNDIVNMGMARYANAPVLIAGDIDRGGVYASFIGTMAVFEEWERNLVKGFIINRFRGDASLLGAANDYLFEYTGKPILGTVPFIQDLNLPEEDSVSFKDGSYFNSSTPGDIKIGLIDLPYVSNFTDMDPLMQESDVEIVLVKTPEELEESFDCVIIPGSKNTSNDLLWLKGKGFPGKLKTMKEAGKTIVGICGGFQMLGTRILDPGYVELLLNSSSNSITGLGMIDIETTFYPEKQLAQKEVLHTPSGQYVKGYEIHHGISHLKKGQVIIESTEGLLGASSKDERVWGTYLHGIFDADGFRQWFLNKLRKDKGLPVTDKAPSVYDIDASLNNLADVLRESMDIKLIKSIIGLD